MVEDEKSKPIGYLLKQDAMASGYVFISLEQYATIKAEHQHLYKPVRWC